MDIDLKKWHRCNIDKDDFKNLCEKSDREGFKHMFIFFGSLFLFGYLAWMTWGTWWSFIFFIIYGNIYSCSDALWHDQSQNSLQIEILEPFFLSDFEFHEQFRTGPLALVPL